LADGRDDVNNVGGA